MIDELLVGMRESWHEDEFDVLRGMCASCQIYRQSLGIIACKVEGHLGSDQVIDRIVIRDRGVCEKEKWWRMNRE